LRASLFWDVMQRVVAISYRRFETTYRIQLKSSWIQHESRLSR